MIFNNDNEEEFGIAFAERNGFQVRQGRRVFRKKVVKTLWGPKAKPHLFKRGIYTKRGQAERIGAAIISGMSVRKIARTIGGSPNTIRKLRNTLSKVLSINILCKCGLPSTHQGWCSFRFSESIARQEFMSNWKARMVDNNLPKVDKGHTDGCQSL